jgi:ribonucleoside-diphosphate reductase subunit M1
MAADRGAYIDQSQSLNIHMKEPTMGKITSMHFAGWKMGLKTGMYYLRTMAASAPIQFTVDQEQLKVADTNVARTNGVAKKRGTGSIAAFNTYSAVPRPMYDQKQPNVPVSTVSTVNSSAEPLRPVSIKPELELTHDSPRPLVADAGTVPDNGQLPEEALDGKKDSQDEDAEDKNDEREQDIYAQKVLACSIENKEACIMCSG